MKYRAYGQSYELKFGSDKARRYALSDKKGNELFETKKDAQVAASSYIKAAMHYPFKYIQYRSTMDFLTTRLTSLLGSDAKS